MAPDGTDFMVPNNLTFEQEQELVENYHDSEYVSNVLRKEIKHELEYHPVLKSEIEYLLSKSDLLQYTDGKLTIPSVSQISVPMNIAKRLAETKDSETILNFWTLLSMNPDPECRKKLLNFLERHKCEILPSGLFVGYRNVVKTKKKETLKRLQVLKKQCEENSTPLDKVWVNYHNGVYDLSCIKTVYGTLQDKLQNIDPDAEFTDSYSRTTSIKIGTPVRMPREECDTDHNITCSAGLHISFKGWKQLEYFGEQTLTCVINPSKVVAVPEADNYCKIRVCEYLPVSVGVVEAQDLDLDFISKSLEVEYKDVSRETDHNFPCSNKISDVRLHQMLQDAQERFVKFK